MRTSILLILTLLLAGSISAQPAQNPEALRLKKEIQALQKLKLQKLDQLEKTDANRWNARYTQGEELKLLETQIQQTDVTYNTISNTIKQHQEDILLLKNALDDEVKNLERTRSEADNFVKQINQTVDELAIQIDTDFPFGNAQRTALYSQVTTELQKQNPLIVPSLDKLIADRFARISMTAEQELTTRAAIFSDGRERTVWNLRLGTVLLAQLDKNSESYQTLFHTGALQGARFSWRSNIDKDYRNRIFTLIGNADSIKTALLPLEVLQNGKLGTATVEAVNTDFGGNLLTWFRNGGLIMYPLVACALLAFLLSLERYITLSIRHHRYTKFYRMMIPKIQSGDWNSVMNYCKGTCTGLTRAIQEIIRQREGNREEAEQHVKQILLAEVPALEKRLSIISTLGATTPLLGLLGTVSGMITLFKVITETGTNDARILSGGIAEALITTQAGLLSAIPIMLIHGYLRERLDDILSHYNETVLDVFNIVFNRKSGAKSNTDVS